MKAPNGNPLYGPRGAIRRPDDPDAQFARLLTTSPTRRLAEGVQELIEFRPWFKDASAWQNALKVKIERLGFHIDESSASRDEASGEMRFFSYCLSPAHEPAVPSLLTIKIDLDSDRGFEMAPGSLHHQDGL